MKKIETMLIRTTLDAAEALFEQNPTEFIDKWCEVLERKCTRVVPGVKKKQKIKPLKMQ